MTNEIPKTEYNPLDEEVIQRSYSSNPIDADNVQPIPEFDFGASFETAKESEPDGGPQPVDYAEQPSFNSQMNELPNKEKTKAAELAADTILASYGSLMGLMSKAVHISEKKLGAEIAEGKIDAGLQLPIDAQGNFVTVGEYTKDFNNTAAEAFAVSDEFNADMRPPLIRVLEKRNIGLTDEQYLMVGFAKDIGTKAVIAFSLRSQTKEILNMMREQTIQMKEASVAHATHFTPAGTSENDGPKPEIVKPDEEDNIPAPKKPAKARADKKVVVSPQDFKPKEPGSNFAEGPKHKGLPTIPTQAELAHLEKAAEIGEKAAKNVKK